MAVVEVAKRMQDPDKIGWQKLLDVSAKLAVLCYGVGYVIEMTYDSVFGVYDLELIRARALYTGCSFVLLVAIIYFTFEVGASWRFVSMPWRHLSERLERYERLPRSLIFLIKSAAKFTILVELTQLSQWLFLAMYVPIDRLNYRSAELKHATLEMAHDHHFFLLVAIQTALLVGLFVSWEFLAEIWPRFAAGTTVVCCVAYVIVTAKINDIPPGMMLWLLAVLMSIQAVRQFLKSSSPKTRLVALLTCLLSTVLYARLIYPSVLPWFGGPPRATVRMVCERGCGVENKQMRLIEETEDGYYLVPDDTLGNDAIFVARSNVKEIAFMSSPKLLFK